jgi:hypothetical protein
LIDLGRKFVITSLGRKKIKATTSKYTKYTREILVWLSVIKQRERERGISFLFRNGKGITITITITRKRQNVKTNGKSRRRRGKHGSNIR